MKTSENGMEMLADYAAIERAIAMLNEHKAQIEMGLCRIVEEITGQPVAAHGLIARMKPGRKSTNHKLAALEWGVPEETIAEFTMQPDPRTSWAKVTKAAGVDTSEYVTWGNPQFVIEHV